MKDPFIVAEISKSWDDLSVTHNIISRQFEKVINTNFERGYSLKEWKSHSYLNKDGVYTETIIAIFELVK